MTIPPKAEEAPTGFVSTVDVEKLLCSKLGIEWVATGMSIASLVDRLAPKADTPECERCGLSSEQHTATHWCDNQSFACTHEAPSHSAPSEPTDLLFEFGGFLTSTKRQWVFSSRDDASPMVEAIREFAARKGLNIDERAAIPKASAPSEPATGLVDCGECLNGCPAGRCRAAQDRAAIPEVKAIPKVVLFLPDGDTRTALVRFVQWEDGALHVCINVRDETPIASEVKAEPVAQVSQVDGKKCVTFYSYKAMYETPLWTKLYAAPVAPEVKAEHPDDQAVDRFAVAMKEKLAKARAKGRGGWDDPEQCTVKQLSNLLHGHVSKGDPVDVANFCMMLQQRGAPISPDVLADSTDPVGAIVTRMDEGGKTKTAPELFEKFKSLPTRTLLYTHPPKDAPTEEGKRHNESYEQGWSDGFEIAMARAETRQAPSDALTLRALRAADMAISSWENGYAFDPHGRSREAQRLVTEALAILAAHEGKV